MKTCLLLIILMLSSISVFAQHYTQSDLTGKWEIKPEKNQSAIIIFTSDSKVSITTEGRTSPKFNYVADFTKDPIRLTLTVKPPKGIPLIWKCLIKFIDENSIKWQVFPNGGDPTNFDDNQATSIILSRR